MTRSFFLSLVFLLMAAVISTAAWADIGIRFRLPLPLGGTASVDGFDQGKISAGEFGLTVLAQVRKDLDVGVGYSYFSAKVDQEVDNSALQLATLGEFENHQLELSTNYTGIKLNKDMAFLISLGLQLPLAGEGRVTTRTTTGISSGLTSTSDTQKTSQVKGAGLFLGAGIERGKWEFLTYYRQIDYAYDLQVTQLDGTSQNTALHITEYGISIGYIFR